jgi:NAD(P)H-hydrate repair Nnr-like enzyme with NAD(P)H-hydrate epimerase domain
MAELEPLYTAQELREAESRHPGFPATAAALMERAGTQAALVALQAFRDARRFAVVCGGGSNGGDGRIVARELERAGRAVGVFDAADGAPDHGEPQSLINN